MGEDGHGSRVSDMELWVPESQLDRVAIEREDDAWVREQWASPTSRLLTVQDAVIGVGSNGGVRLDEASGEYDPERHFLIGRIDGVAHFATAGTVTEPSANARVMLARLDDTERDLVSTSVALLNWHTISSHCGVCGSATSVLQGGHVRWCPVCERERFPRTDPAVITAIVDADDRLLLAHNTAWPANRMSLIAGFVDAGESLEQAVRRESAEEVSVSLASMAYVSSQPWPFPRSLMLGFAARAASPDIRVDGVELDEARWFTHAEFDEAIESGRLGAPSASSIASSMIRLWHEGALPTPPVA